MLDSVVRIRSLREVLRRFDVGTKVASRRRMICEIEERADVDVQLLVRVGGRGLTVSGARALLSRYRDLDALSAQGAEALQASGVDRRVAIRLVDAFALARRMRHVAFRARIDSPAEVLIHVADLADLRKEVIVALHVDARCALIQRETVAVGSLNVARASPRDVLAGALRSDAFGIVVVHNHPSGVPEPSVRDRAFTETLVQACELLGLTFYDHLIVARSGFVSFRERGLIAPSGD